MERNGGMNEVAMNSRESYKLLVPLAGDVEVNESAFRVFHCDEERKRKPVYRLLLKILQVFPSHIFSKLISQFAQRIFAWSSKTRSFDSSSRLIQAQQPSLLPLSPPVPIRLYTSTMVQTAHLR